LMEKHHRGKLAPRYPDHVGTKRSALFIAGPLGKLCSFVATRHRKRIIFAI